MTPWTCNEQGGGARTANKTCTDVVADIHFYYEHDTCNAIVHRINEMQGITAIVYRHNGVYPPGGGRVGKRCKAPRRSSIAMTV